MYTRNYIPIQLRHGWDFCILHLTSLNHLLLSPQKFRYKTVQVMRMFRSFIQRNKRVKTNKVGKWVKLEGYYLKALQLLMGYTEYYIALL